MKNKKLKVRSIVTLTERLQPSPQSDKQAQTGSWSVNGFAGG